MKPNVLLTGATGFVGGAVLRYLRDQGHAVTVAARASSKVADDALKVIRIDELDGQTNWRAGLENIQVVVHSAARVHVMVERDGDPLGAFRKVNVEGTLNLARQAAKAGAKRFVFISSVKVNGEATLEGRPFTADDTPAPTDPYGISKREAEDGLRQLARECGLEVVIIRPVLVYGPGVKANFQAMMRWLVKGVPLPLGCIDNRRSLVALDNLAHLVMTCTTHPAAANQTFLVSDGEDLSTPELLRRMGQALGRPARLLPVPALLLRLAATGLGRRALGQRLCGSLQVDMEKTHRVLDWRPPVSVDDAFALTAHDFLERSGR